MKILFICLTDFQILNALNLQMHQCSEKKAGHFFYKPTKKEMIN